MNQHILKQFNISVQVSLQFKADFSNVSDMKNKINSDILSRCTFYWKPAMKLLSEFLIISHPAEIITMNTSVEAL